MPDARVAQLVEQRIENPRVGGSNPPPGTIIIKGLGRDAGAFFIILTNVMHSSNRRNVMQTFKLTPKPKSDYRLEVKEIKKKCELEKHGYRHNKIVYGFCVELPDLSELQSLGLNIEEIDFDKAQMNLTNGLVGRGRAKSKIDHLKFDREESGAENEPEEAVAEQKLADLNNSIQAAKEALSITGTVKLLKF